MYPAKDVGPEEWEEIKDIVERRMNTGYPAAYRRRQRDTPDDHFTHREQLPHPFHRNTPHIRIGRIVIDKIIPEHPPPGFAQLHILFANAC